MVVRLTSIIAVLCLFCFPALGAQRRQFCLSCHPSHHADRGTCTGCHRGNPDSNRKNIAHQGLIAGRFARFRLGNVPELREGERLMERLACRRCHVSGERGNRLATSFDTLLGARTPGEIRAAITSPAIGMPAFGLTDNQIAALVNAIFAGTPRKQMSTGEKPSVVHFAQQGKARDDIFTRTCGACHRMLTRHQGSMGSGSIGPNLSGLLSGFYPMSFRGREQWTMERLQPWLQNPRRFSRYALMPPLSLDSREFRELQGILEAAEP